jgi:hypothetical protein
MYLNYTFLAQIVHSGTENNSKYGILISAAMYHARNV